MCSRMPARQANQAVFLALLKPGDTMLGMSLAAGGHLTHGARAEPVRQVVSRGRITACAREDARIDFDEVERLAADAPAEADHRRRQRLSADHRFRPLPRDRRRGRRLSDGRHGAFRRARRRRRASEPAAARACRHHDDAQDAARPARRHDPRATTRRSRKRINSAVFPGLQGGPLMHVIAAKAVALGEALRRSSPPTPSASSPTRRPWPRPWPRPGCAIVSGGTDTHLLLVDLRPLGLTGRDAEQALERAGMTCNKNGIPFDPEKPTVTSGIRLGSPAATTRGFGHGRIPPGRRMDRRGAARSGAATRTGMRRVEAAGARRGRRAVRPVPDLRMTGRARRVGRELRGPRAKPAGRRRGCAVRSAAPMTPR